MRLRKRKAVPWSYKMKKIPLASTLAVLLLFFCSCSSTPMSVLPENQYIPADFSGIIHGATRTQKEYAYLDYLGANWVLKTFYWTDIEPEKGDWNFLDYDDIVNRSKSSGIKVLGLLAYDNWWIHDDKDTHKYIPPARIPDFLEYVRKTVEHFQGRVDAWCIWNEPNFHFWTGTDEEFIELSRQTAGAVKETDSEVILLGGAFNRGVFGLPEKFARALFESGAMEKVDAVAFHPYELNPARTLSLYNQFKKIADDYGFGDKIWVTEVGYPTGGWYPTKVKEKKLPEYVIKTWVLLAAGGTNKLFWYELFDSVKRSKSNSEDFFGLVRSKRDYTSKGAEAFRLCAKFLQDTNCSVLENGEDLSGSLRSFWFKGAEGGALVIWNESSGSKQVRLRLPGTDNQASIEAFSHDPVSGKMSPIQADTVIKVGKMPVFITYMFQHGSPDYESKPVISKK